MSNKSIPTGTITEDQKSAVLEVLKSSGSSSSTTSASGAQPTLEDRLDSLVNAGTISEELETQLLDF